MTIFADKAELLAFRADVSHYLRADYMLPCGTVVKGQALTHLRDCLRMGGGPSKLRWRISGGFWGFTSQLECAGFTLTRARTMRHTRNGLYKPYQVCDVVRAPDDQPALAAQPA